MNKKYVALEILEPEYEVEPGVTGILVVYDSKDLATELHPMVDIMEMEVLEFDTSAEH